jgi:hypothetical protein
VLGTNWDRQQGKENEQESTHDVKHNLIHSFHTKVALCYLGFVRCLRWVNP